MSVIGEGSEFVALMPGALEALVSNIRSRFAPASHTHGTSGIQNGAVTVAKLAGDVTDLIDAAGGCPTVTVYDADADGSVEVTSSSVNVTLSESPAEAARMRLTFNLASTSHIYACDVRPQHYMYTFVSFVDAYNDGSRVTQHNVRVSLSDKTLTLRHVGATSLAGEVLPLSDYNRLWLKAVEIWKEDGSGPTYANGDSAAW